MTPLNDLGVNVARKFERTGMMDGRKYKWGGREGKVTSAERRRKGWKPTKPRDESEGNSVLYRAASGPRWVGGSVSRM